MSPIRSLPLILGLAGCVGAGKGSVLDTAAGTVGGTDSGAVGAGDDGVGGSTNSDVDGDGWLNPDDCAPEDARVHPGADEVCNGLDDDCDGLIDDGDDAVSGTFPFYFDRDGDGFGDPESPIDACAPPLGTVDNGADCDDTDGSANPAGTETCGPGDEDCDGLVNEADDSLVGTTTFYLDRDGDGFGDPDAPVQACAAPSGAVGGADDCDDADATVHPGAAEVCEDGAINDCDATASEATADCPGFGGTIRPGAADAHFTGTYYEMHGGRVILDAGDVNGDLVPDIAVGASWATTDPRLQHQGAVYLFTGGPRGEVPLPTADVVLVGARAYGYAGAAVAGGADVDADGYDDLLVGLPGEGGGGSGAGAIALVRGPATGLTDLDGATLLLDGAATGDNLGTGVAFAGDHDGDRLPDALLAARRADTGAADGGAIWLVSGADTGTADVDRRALARLDGTDGVGWAGEALTSGDFDGDGQADVAVGGPGAAAAGKAWVVYGPLAGTLDLADADAIVTGTADSMAGRALCAADLDGDGHSELGVGAPRASAGGSEAGGVFVFAGPVAGDLGLLDAPVQVRGTAGDRLGGACDLRGDFDGDGAAELFVGSGTSIQRLGVVDVYTGADTAWLFSGPLTGVLGPADAVHTLPGGDDFGHALSFLGDQNGDGRSELLVGEPDSYAGGYLWLSRGF
jgi:hypothetical protein